MTMFSGISQKGVAVDQRVLILMLPFATPLFPGLGANLIRSILNENGIPTDILFGNLILSRIAGRDPFIDFELSQLPMSEVVFTPYYFETPRDEAAANLARYMREITSDPSSHSQVRYAPLVDQAGECLRAVFDAVRWDDYDIVGFSVMMGQTIASLAMARMIKAARPKMRIVFGGPNAAFPMSVETLRSFPEVDFVLEGEADNTISPLIRCIRENGNPMDIPGLVYRGRDNMVHRTKPAAPNFRLDALPIPDFGPFFSQAEALEIDHVQPYLTLETSRGCWWGQKHHCTFCGIDDALMKFRSKSPARVLEEILVLSKRHEYTEFFAVDSIINLKFFDELLPLVGRLRDDEEFDFSFFFESKSNLRRDQTQLFRSGGVNVIQPGLESFSDHILELMNKGSTSARQIQCLKLCAEQRIATNWNLIIRNPGESPDDIREMLEAIPYLHHLPPLHGEGLIDMQVSRFAPYHNEPNRFNLENLRPKDYYRAIFPRDDINRGELAYYFDYDFVCSDHEDLTVLYGDLQHALWIWRECYREDSLTQARGPGFLEIIDRRSTLDGQADHTEKVTILREPWSEIFSACDEVTTEDKIVYDFRGFASATEIKSFLKRLVAERLVFRSRAGELINLPLLKEARYGRPTRDGCERPETRQAETAEV